MHTNQHLISGTVYTADQYLRFFEDLAISPLPSPIYPDNFLKPIKKGYQQLQSALTQLHFDNAMQNSIAQFTRPVIWLFITEPWCGDANANTPAWLKVAQSCPNIELKIVLRDQNIALIDQYLTNGGRSIPKLICIDAQTGEDIGTWGPRPAALQNLIPSIKEQNPSFRDYVHAVEDWYLADKMQHLLAEIQNCLSTWQKSAATI